MATALRDDSWGNITGQDWFEGAQAMASEEDFFHWELEFPVAFYGEDGGRKKGAGFDAVIGNPPYVKIQNLRKTSYSLADYLSEYYVTSTKRFDIYAPFVERGSQLSKNNHVAYILPNKFFESGSGEGLRKFLTSQNRIDEILDFGQKQVFEGATTYTCILSLGGGDSFRYGPVDEETTAPFDLSEVDFGTIESSEISEDPWVLVSPDEREILQKMESQGTPIGDHCEYLSEGIVSGDNEIFFVEIESRGIDFTTVRTPIDGETRDLESDMVHPLGMGDEINRYTPPDADMGVIYPYVESADGTKPINEERLKSEYPQTYSYLSSYKERLENRGSSSMSYRTWYALYRPREKYLFESKKLVTPDICQHPKFTLDDNGEEYFADTVYGIVPKDNTPENRRFLLALLNSSLNWFYIYHTSPVLRGGFRRFKTAYLEKVPVIPGIPGSDYDSIETIDSARNTGGVTALATLGDRMLSLNQRRHSLNLSLLDYLGNYTEGPKLPDVGLFQPTSSNILDATTEDYEKLRVGDVKTERDDYSVTVYATARYKPEEEEEFETDQWGYTETDYKEVFTLADLTKEEAALIEAFVPVAVEEADGFAGFRDNATKTNSPIDRLKGITLPDPDDVADDLDRYIQTKERADELDEKIEEADQLIDELVYDLYGLTDEEIEIVESAVQGN